MDKEYIMLRSREEDCQIDPSDFISFLLYYSKKKESFTYFSNKPFRDLSFTFFMEPYGWNIEPDFNVGLEAKFEGGPSRLQDYVNCSRRYVLRFSEQYYNWYKDDKYDSILYICTQSMYDALEKVLDYPIDSIRIYRRGICASCGKSIFYNSSDKFISKRHSLLVEEKDTVDHKCHNRRLNEEIIAGVYFFGSREDNLVKIGYSSNVHKRFISIKTSSGRDDLKISAILPIEQEDNLRIIELELHKKFETYRENGEWFEFSSEIRKYISEIKDKIIIQS